MPADVGHLACVDHVLDDRRDQECRNRQDEADAELAQRRELPDLVDRGVEPVVVVAVLCLDGLALDDLLLLQLLELEACEDGDEKEDQNGVHHLDLARVPLDPYEHQVHLLRLEDPSSTALVVERPEHGDEEEDDRDLEGREQSLLAGDLLEELHTARLDVGVLLPSQPEDEGCDGHHHSGSSECDGRPVVVEEPGRQDDRDGRSGVDAHIEPVHHLVDELGVLLPELVTHVGADTRLDAAAAERDEGESDRQSRTRLVEGQDQAAERVDDREPEDGSVLPENGVREERSEHREEVVGAQEHVVPDARLFFDHDVEQA